MSTILMPQTSWNRDVLPIEKVQMMQNKAPARYKYHLLAVIPPEILSAETRTALTARRT